jgi:predicted permease
MDSIFQDVRYALRVLRKSPGFTTVSILTLALGIVGTTLVFNAYNATVWEPLPVKEPQRLAILDRHLRKGGENAQFSIDDYRRLSDHTRLLSGVAAEGSYETVLGELPSLATGKLDEPRQALIKAVSDNYFDVLGVDAPAGRVFHGGDKPSSAPIAVLSYSSWHRRFRNDPAILGKTAVIYGVAVTIVGIAPQDFVGSGDPPIPPDFWVPLSAEAVIEPQRQARSGNEQWLRVLGRLAPGATRTQVESELTALEQQHEKQSGVEPVTASIVAGPAFYFVEPSNPQFRALGALLLASFSMVLLVACANMANFFMARATRRRREMAVRSALGASRIRLVRQLMTEGILLGLGAGVLAVVASAWICELLWVEIEQRIISRFTDLYYFTFTFVPTWRVLAATCAVSVLAGALFSLAGAVQSSRVDLNEAIKGCELTIATGRRVRLSIRDLLIAVQVMLSVMLLVSAAVLARGMVRGQSADPGFHTSDVLDIEFDGLSSAGFDAAHSAALREQLHARMTAIGGVKQVAFASHVPMLGSGAADIRRPGGETHRALDNDISPDFFHALGIPIVRGRDFTASEIAQRAAVVIVSQATVRNLWPGQDPLGKFVEVGKDGRALQVIGVAQDVRSVNIGLIEPYFLYLPLAPDAPLSDVLIRTTGEASHAIPDALKAAADVDHRLASLAVAHSLDDALWFQRLPSLIATIFATIVGSLALILASVGIYGTIAYAVAQRTREIGIRMALGAPNLSIVRLVLARTMALVGAGAAVGLVGAAAVSHAVAAVPFGLQSMLLFGTSPRDPASFAAVAVFLLMVAFVAGYRPAARATKVDPMVALRYE